MNYLAHLLLSPPDAAFRVGNLLPDLLRLAEVESFSGQYRLGIEQHRRIDAFTDTHPVFQRSKERLWPDYRRFSGVIVDIVYDHCLIVRWPEHHPEPLFDFIAEIRQSLPRLRADLREETFRHIEGLTERIPEYGTLAGVARSLERISRYRLRRPVDFSGLLPVLERSESGFLSDFDEFFPQLRAMTERTPSP